MDVFVSNGSVIFLPAHPVSQTHDSHKGRMILNHESPTARIKNCGEKSAFSICNFRFECFLLAHRVLNNIGKNLYRKTPQQYKEFLGAKNFGPASPGTQRNKFVKKSPMAKTQASALQNQLQLSSALVWTLSTLM